jgi:hypothetical protein
MTAMATTTTAVTTATNITITTTANPHFSPEPFYRA